MLGLWEGDGNLKIAYSENIILVEWPEGSSEVDHLSAVTILV